MKLFVVRAGPFGIAFIAAAALGLLIVALNFWEIESEGVIGFAPAITAFLTAWACGTYDDGEREHLWGIAAVAGALPWFIWVFGYIALILAGVRM